MNKNKKKRIPMQTPNECDRINDNGYNDKWSMLSPQASTFRDNGSVFFFFMHFIRSYSFRIFFFTPFHSDCGSSNEIFIRTLRKKNVQLNIKRLGSWTKEYLGTLKFLLNWISQYIIWSLFYCSFVVEGFCTCSTMRRFSLFRTSALWNGHWNDFNWKTCHTLNSIAFYFSTFIYLLRWNVLCSTTVDVSLSILSSIFIKKIF